MTRLGERTGRRLHIVEYAGHPDAERVLVVMGSGAETVRETVACAQRARRAGRRRAGAAVPAVPGPGAARRAARERAPDRGAGPDQGARLDRRAAVPRRGRRADRGARGRRAGPAAGDRRPLRPVVEGVHPGHGRRGVRGARARAAAAPVHDRHQRRRLRDEPALRRRRWTSSRPTRSARSSSGSARTERSARTRTRSRSSGPSETCTPRATSSTTRRSRARRPCRTCASGRSRSGRRTSSQHASFVGCHHFGLLEQVDVLGRAAPGATLLLNCRHAPDEVWDALPRPVQEQILAKRIDVYAIDAGRIAREVGLAGRINIVLQTCFFAISGVLPRDEAIVRDQGGDRQDLRQARRRGGRTQPRRGRPDAGGAAPDRGARPGHGHARAAAAGARARARSSSAPSPRR